MPKTNLKSLHIYASFGKEGYRGTAEFEGHHKVELRLDDQLANDIVRLCVDKISSAIHEAADAVNRETLLRGEEIVRKEIEHQEDGGV